MDDISYQKISINQSDLARKYLVANAAQDLTEQEKNQVFSNIGMKSWIDKTYPDLGGSGGGVSIEGIGGENGSIQYSNGTGSLLYSGLHVYSNASIYGQLRMSGSKASNGEISFDYGLPSLHFGNDVYPSGFSSPSSYSDAWMPNVAMVKALISGYGGGGSGSSSCSLQGLTNGNMSYSSAGDYVYCTGMMSFDHDVRCYSQVYARSGICLGDSGMNKLSVTNNILYYNGRKVLTE